MLVRTILILFTLFTGGLALFGAHFGEPPTWTFFGPTESVVVVATRIDDTGVRPRYQPVVTIRRSDGTTAEVGGVPAAFTPEVAESALTATWPLGGTVTLRVWDERYWPPFGGRDWTAFVVMVFAGLLALVGAALLFRIAQVAIARRLATE